MAGGSSTRIEPATAWTVVTDSPLKGMALAREAGTILAWDEGNQLYLLDVQGESLSFSRVPHRILAGAISDEGSVIALLVEDEDAGLVLLEMKDVAAMPIDEIRDCGVEALSIGAPE